MIVMHKVLLIFPICHTGDLTISVNVLYNYLEANSKVPWEDLRYLFGEIMYGGHITDDWDRVLCRTYLEEFLHPDQVVSSGRCPFSLSHLSGRLEMLVKSENYLV